MPRESNIGASPSPGFPDFSAEQRHWDAGARHVCGIDEVGRGPLAGPVVVAAVILPRGFVAEGLTDSKLLAPATRERLADRVLSEAMVSVVAAPPSTIFSRNILQATLWAMEQAVAALPVEIDHALVDGNVIPRALTGRATALVGGDALSLSIAAASVVAKVTRDRMCGIMHAEEPHYGFLSHKGYSAPQHMAALATHGPGRHHRMDFAPCRVALEQKRAASTTLPAVNPAA